MPTKEYARAAFLKHLEENPLCYICKVNPHASNYKRCNPCRRIYVKEKRAQDAGGWYKRLTPEQKQKRRARAVVYQRIKRGKMKRIPCEGCGNPNSEKHHYAGYSPEQAGTVKDFCKLCHVQEDKKLTASSV